jgi:hypothetical protein
VRAARRRTASRYRSPSLLPSFPRHSRSEVEDFGMPLVRQKLCFAVRGWGTGSGPVPATKQSFHQKGCVPKAPRFGTKTEKARLRC